VSDPLGTLPTRLPREPAQPPAPESKWARLKRLARRDVVELVQGSNKGIASIVVPSIFLAWGIFGMVRPAFDSTQVYDPIFWAVAGASLLTLYGRFHTRGLDVDDEDVEEPLEDKWRFEIPHIRHKDKDRK
jgi:hypothetical protein